MDRPGREVIPGAPVTLQINLAPTDLPHAHHILPHQLRQWAGQVDDIVFTVDLRRSRGKFAEGWDERLPGLQRLIDGLCTEYGHARTVAVDYSAEARAEVSAKFFGGRPIPLNDYRGGPFYAYLYGVHSAQHDHVFHSDSDMLYGGGSQTWMSEALALLARPDVLACNPLPGPPTADGSLRSQVLDREAMGPPAFRAPAVSTRVFLLDRLALPEMQAEVLPVRPAVGAWMDGNPRVHVTEFHISRAMARQGLVRIDFLGEAPGMWSLHPPYRSERFYERLPALVREVETGQVVEGQRGCHDIEDCTVDWSDVRPSGKARMTKHLRSLRDRIRS